MLSTPRPLIRRQHPTGVHLPLKPRQERGTGSLRPLWSVRLRPPGVGCETGAA